MSADLFDSFSSPGATNIPLRPYRRITPQDGWTSSFSGVTHDERESPILSAAIYDRGQSPSIGMDQFSSQSSASVDLSFLHIGNATTSVCQSLSIKSTSPRNTRGKCSSHCTTSRSSVESCRFLLSYRLVCFLFSLVLYALGSLYAQTQHPRGHVSLPLQLAHSSSSREAPANWLQVKAGTLPQGWLNLHVSSPRREYFLVSLDRFESPSPLTDREVVEKVYAELAAQLREHQSFEERESGETEFLFTDHPHWEQQQPLHILLAAFRKSISFLFRGTERAMLKLSNFWKSRWMQR